MGALSLLLGATLAHDWPALDSSKEKGDAFIKPSANTNQLLMTMMPRNSIKTFYNYSTWGNQQKDLSIYQKIYQSITVARVKVFLRKQETNKNLSKTIGFPQDSQEILRCLDLKSCLELWQLIASNHNPMKTLQISSNLHVSNIITPSDLGLVFFSFILIKLEKDVHIELSPSALSMSFSSKSLWKSIVTFWCFTLPTPYSIWVSPGPQTK